MLNGPVPWAVAQVAGIKEANVNSAEELTKFFMHCYDNRSVSATKLNDRSSRSHAIYTITIRVTSTEVTQGANGAAKVSCHAQRTGSAASPQATYQGQLEHAVLATVYTPQQPSIWQAPLHVPTHHAHPPSVQPATEPAAPWLPACHSTRPPCKVLSPRTLPQHP